MSSMKSSEWVYIGNRGRFRRWPRIRTSASVVLCCRATWRWLVGSRSYRRKLHCPWRRAGALWWSGRCCPWRWWMRPRACRQEGSGGGAVGCQGWSGWRGGAGDTWRASSYWPRAGTSRNGCGARRGGTSTLACQTHALGVPRARPPSVRRNAVACQMAWLELRISSSSLGLVEMLVDMLV